MKKLLLALSIILLIGCKSKLATNDATQDSFVKIIASDVDETKKNKAYALGKRVLMTCNTSKFKKFDDTEATVSVIQNTTEERLTKTCIKFRQFYGEFKDLELQEILQNTKDNSTLFRYKAQYTKKVANKELRVTMNAENKVSSIKSLDWVDLFDPN